MTTAPPEPVPPGALDQRLVRFDAGERVVHWANATLFGILIVTAAILYVGQLSALVGRRDFVRQVHVVSGLLLPIPILLGLIGPWRRGLRADIRALNRWDADDWRWLRSRGRDRAARLGKFNPGQKLNAAFVAGAIGVVLASGSIMEWFSLFPIDWRTGATFVHDWTAIAIFLVVVGHIGMALADGDALRAILRGWVPAAWARHKRPKWYEEMTNELPTDRTTDPPTEPTGDT